MKPLAAFVVPAPPAPVPAPPAPVAAASPEPELDELPEPELPEPELPEPELPEPEDPELLELELEPALLALDTMSPTSLLTDATVPANGAISFVPLSAS
jgi:hypothetical protein